MLTQIDMYILYERQLNAKGLTTDRSTRDEKSEITN